MLSEVRRCGALSAALESGWTPSDVRRACKMIRRYQLEGQPFSNWMTDLPVVRLAIGIALALFFARLSNGAPFTRGDCR